MKYVICATQMPAEVEADLPGASPAAGNFLRSIRAGIEKSGNKVSECSYVAISGAGEAYAKHGILPENVVFKDKTIIPSVRAFQKMVLNVVDSGDVVLFYNVVYYDLGLTEKLKKKGAIPVLILADYTDSSEEKGSLLRKLIAYRQGIEFRNFDYGIVLSEEAKHFFNKSAKTVIMEGGVVPERFDGIAPIGHDKITRFLYAGTFSEVTGVDVLLKAISLISDPDLEFYFSGKGELVREVISAAEKDQRVKYLGFMNDEEYIKVLNNTHVFINPRNMGFKQNRNNFPSKVLEYLACGRPVISTRFPGYNRFEDYFIFCDDGMEPLKNAIENAATISAAEYSEYYSKNRLKAQEFSWDKQIIKILELTGNY